MPSLTRIVPWSHQLVAEVLQPGDFAVDLTVGKGRDTLALAKAVGPDGLVVGFDVQTEALAMAAEFLFREGYEPRRKNEPDGLDREAGIVLTASCHSNLSAWVPRTPQAIIANLGYLPGGDPALVTATVTTITALQQALEVLAPGGRLAVTVYPGHAGGAEEARSVESLLQALPCETWQVLNLKVANRPEAPFLMVAEARNVRL